MGSLLEQFFSLLASETGSLTYHLVLAFSIAGALTITFNQGDRGDVVRYRRNLLGLILLLILQLTLFVFSGLAWQGVIDENVLLPPLDRAVILLSLVLIIWMWAFPQPAPSADAAALILGLLVIPGTILGILWWDQQVVITAFNGTWLDIAAQVTALVLALSGILILAVRRTDGWGYGVLMLVSLCFGFILHLILLFLGQSYRIAIAQDYALAVRVFQMVAFPFLLVLPGRFIEQSDETSGFDGKEVQGIQTSTSEEKNLYGSPNLWRSLTKLSTETESHRVCHGIVSTVAKTMEADFCLLLSPPDHDGFIHLKCGYELSHERYIEGLSIDSHALPMLTSALRMGRPRKLHADSTSPDMMGLKSLLHQDRIGNVLSVPLLSSDGKAIACMILLSPFSLREWTDNDLVFLTTLSRLLVHFLQRSKQMMGLNKEITQARQMTHLAQEQARQALDEKQRLQDQLFAIQDDSEHSRAQLSSMAAMVEVGVTAQDTIEKLHAEIEELQQAANLGDEENNGKSEPLEGELRLALEEISFLNESLAEAEEKISKLRLAQDSGSTATDGQLATITAIGQDLRQPLSSIIGYTDFLLGESIGILGGKQRKYLERIKISTERMSRLIDDLFQVTITEREISQLDVGEFDLRSTINNAVKDLEIDPSEREISIEVDLPDEPLDIYSDQSTLVEILNKLVINAIEVTQPGGVVSISARLESNEVDQDYILVQIAVGGEGIAPENIPFVFSHSADGTKIPGISGGDIDLPSVKALVEVLGGRTWVDSEPGDGAIFSVLLPVKYESVDEDSGDLLA
jgi:signal transduction histidine kinase